MQAVVSEPSAATTRSRPKGRLGTDRTPEIAAIFAKTCTPQLPFAATAKPVALCRLNVHRLVAAMGQSVAASLLVSMI